MSDKLYGTGEEGLKMPCHITDGPADNWPDDDGEDPTIDERVTEQRMQVNTITPEPGQEDKDDEK